MAMFGELNEDVWEAEKIPLNLEWAEFYFTANTVEDNRRVSNFISMVRCTLSSYYETYWHLIVTGQVSSGSLQLVVGAL